MIELVLTINDKDGSYTEHAGVVLASVFANTAHKINVHIVHDDSVSEENKLKLNQLTDSFGHNIHFYHVTVPHDLYEVASGVHKINFWTMASMYRLLLPLFIHSEKVIYLDCDILVNMDINELWSIDLGDRYLGAVIDQGQNLMEYFVSLGLSAELYFNSGVILFHLDNIRAKQTWYEEMLAFLRHFPTVTMPDQDVLNAIYSSNYLQLDLRYNTFAHSDLDLDNKIVHFAGDNKWWDSDSPAAWLYYKFLAMTPWAREVVQEQASEPEQVNIVFDPPPVQPEEAYEPPPVPEIQHVDTPPPPFQEPVILPPPLLPQFTAAAPEIVPPVLESTPVKVKPHRRKHRSSRLRRLLRLRKKLRLRRKLKLKLRRKKALRAKYRTKKRIKLIKRRYVKRRRALLAARKRLALIRRKKLHARKKAVPVKKIHRVRRTA
ncbi:hypothetical protein C2I18_11445 [Paenibacillus sp. PK3_47]|uniref:glycosyltransferase family 8 protein n=1 Tax=Paenibacillus sp. PK3_47 TaxID=2072642 RepID=UPI00201D794A|nr:glycosyltransferase family 8 protein [Paenibacillus sp. PK3_47]UQZ34088.1 hypothetical protein C2I18_11445 [Paenibacillus sp. PK3_47]